MTLGSQRNKIHPPLNRNLIAPVVVSCIVIANQTCTANQYSKRFIKLDLGTRINSRIPPKKACYLED
jgi:hypothetical protein